MWCNDFRPDSELTTDRYSLTMLDSKNNYKRLLRQEDEKRTIA